MILLLLIFIIFIFVRSCAILTRSLSPPIRFLLFPRETNITSVFTVVQFLVFPRTCSAVPYCDEITLEKESTEISGETKELLSLYHKTFDDERV